MKPLVKKLIDKPYFELRTNRCLSRMRWITATLRIGTYTRISEMLDAIDSAVSRESYRT